MIRFFLYGLIFFTGLLLATPPALRAQTLKGTLVQKNFTSRTRIEQIGGMLFTSVRLNGQSKPYRFLIDTGAPTAVSKELAAQLNLLEFNKVLVGSSGSLEDSASFVEVPRIRIGDVEFTGVSALALNLHAGEVISCEHIDGIIGASLMSLCTWQFNKPKLEITITDQPQTLNYLKEAKETRFNFWGEQKTPVLEAEINGNPIEEDIMLDTGYNGLFSLARPSFKFLIDQDELSAKKIVQGKGTTLETVFGVERDSLDYYAYLDEINLGSEKLFNIGAEIDLSENSRLGNEILDYYIMTIDFPNQKIYTYRYSNELFPDSFRTFGLKPYFNDHEVFVAFLWDNSPAKKAGIALHDQLVRVNHVNLKHINHEDKCRVYGHLEKEMYRQETLDIEYLHNGELRRVKLTKAKLLGI